jgi:hypothetical protein
MTSFAMAGFGGAEFQIHVINQISKKHAPPPNQDLTFPPPTLVTNVYAITSTETIAMAVPPIKLQNSFAKIKILRTSKNSSNSRRYQAKRPFVSL